jgi:hypothetical protein
MEGLEGEFGTTSKHYACFFRFSCRKRQGLRGVYGRARLPNNLKVFAKRVRFAVGVVKLDRYARRALSTPATTARRVTGVARLFDENHKSLCCKQAVVPEPRPTMITFPRHLSSLPKTPLS